MLDGGLDGPCHGIAHEMLCFGKDLLDGVEVWAIGWEEDKVRTSVPDQACMFAGRITKHRASGGQI